MQLLPFKNTLGVNPIGALFVIHFIGDFYQSFINPLIPVIKDQFTLSMTQIGFIVSIVTFSSYIIQPLAGLLADRFEPHRFMYSGLMLSVLFIPFACIIPWYGLLVTFIGLGALGSSMYHPTAAGLVSTFAVNRAGVSMAIFGLGGTLAFAIGPLAVTAFVISYGATNLPYTSLPGLLASVYLIFILPTAGSQMRINPKAETVKGLFINLCASWQAIVLIWLIGVIRSLVDVAIRSFYPILYMEKENSLVSVGAILSIYTVGSAISAITCGYFADRKGYKPIFYLSFLLSTPIILLFLYSSGFWIYPLSFLVGFILLATMFPSISLATQIATKNKALVSSVAGGFAIGVGGMMAPLIGWSSEVFGLQTTLSATALIPIVCLFFIRYIPEDPNLQRNK